MEPPQHLADAQVLPGVVVADRATDQGKNDDHAQREREPARGGLPRRLGTGETGGWGRDIVFGVRVIGIEQTFRGHGSTPLIPVLGPATEDGGRGRPPHLRAGQCPFTGYRRGVGWR